MDKPFLSDGYTRRLRRLLNSSIEGWTADGKQVVRGAQHIAECRSENEAALVAETKEALLPALNEVIRLRDKLAETQEDKEALARTVSKQHQQITKLERALGKTKEEL
jgi:hypothetical protein